MKKCLEILPPPRKQSLKALCFVAIYSELGLGNWNKTPSVLLFPFTWLAIALYNKTEDKQKSFIKKLRKWVGYLFMKFVAGYFTRDEQKRVGGQSFRFPFLKR